jgi:hypothetical protein
VLARLGQQMRGDDILDAVLGCRRRLLGLRQCDGSEVFDAAPKRVGVPRWIVDTAVVREEGGLRLKCTVSWAQCEPS